MEDNTFNIGDSVMVKSGVSDPDLGTDLGGWQGRIAGVEKIDEKHTLVSIQWDSLTLKALSLDIVAHCERKGLDWSVMNLYTEDVEPVAPRDAQQDVEDVVEEIESQTRYLHLGEEGELIQQVLTGVDPSDYWEAFETWYEYLEKSLTFPFDAEIYEPQERGPLQAGDRLRVRRLNDIADPYGVLVEGCLRTNLDHTLV